MSEEEKPEPLTIPPAPPPQEAVMVEKPKEKTATIIEKIIENLEQTYRLEKAKEIEELYNDFVDAIARHRAHISNILTAIELIKHDVINQKLEQIRREQEGQAGSAKVE